LYPSQPRTMSRRNRLHYRPSRINLEFALRLAAPQPQTVSKQFADESCKVQGPTFQPAVNSDLDE
jgi:hypothetical protein